MVAPVFSSKFISVHVLAGSRVTLFFIKAPHVFLQLPHHSPLNPQGVSSDKFHLYIPRSTAGRSSKIFYLIKKQHGSRNIDLATT